MLKSQVAILSISALAVLGSVGLPEPAAEPGVLVQLPGISLRTVEDSSRGRRWELGWGAVSVYDAATNRPIRRVALEAAILTQARGACRPDMLLDRSGAVLVSSNTQPVIWRVDPERFEVERFDIRLDDESGRDVGFSGLAWPTDGQTLYALDASTRAPWRIDLAERKAARVEAAGMAQTC